MYRLLTINRLAVENSRLSLYWHKKHVVGLKDFGGSIYVGRRDANAVLLQPAKYKMLNNENPKAIYCQLQQNFQFIKPLVESQNVIEKVTATPTTTIEDNSAKAHSLSITPAEYTTTATAEANKTRGNVEILKVTNTAANERKSRLESIATKKLQRFITKTKEEVLKKMKYKQMLKSVKNIPTTIQSRKKLSVQQPIEYQKINMDSVDSSLLESGSYDHTPLVFFKKDEEVITTTVLNNPKKIQKIIKSFHNFRDIIETLEHDNMENDIYSLHNAKLDIEEETLDALDSAKPYISPGTLKDIKKNQKTKAKATNKTAPRYKSNTHHNEKQERLAKDRALRINLTIYLNLCASIGLQNRGLSTLLTYRQRAQKHNSKTSFVTIDLYNILLHGFAEKGSFNRFNEIFKLIKEDGLQFNEQTFAAIFECLGRLEESSDNVEKIKTYINKAESMNMTLHQIMDKSKFISDQRDIALDAIQRVLPDFVPCYTPPDLKYNNMLLNSLNENVLSFEETLDTHDVRVDGAEIMNSKLGFYKAQLLEMAKEQLQIELDGSITIKSIEKPKEFSNAEFCREKLKDLEIQWRSHLATAVARDLNTLKARMRYKPQGYMNYHTYLNTLNASEYVDIIINEIYKLAEGSETFSPTISQLFKELGQKVQQRYQIEQKKQNGVLEKTGEIYNEYCDVWDKANTSDNTRQIWQRLVHKNRNSGPSMDIIDASWPPNVLMGVGRFLYNILMRDVKIDTFVMRKNQKNQHLMPAFYTLFRNHCRLMKEEVKPHPVLARLLRASRQQTLTFDSNLVPMLCPPQPWTTPHTGGYLLNKSELIRLPNQAIQQWERINNMPVPNIYPALDSLNQLASVPWRVNTDILDVIIKVFQEGGNNKLDVPQSPNTLPPLPTIPEKDENMSNVERAQLFKEKMLHRRKQSEMYSLWCDTLYRLSLANHYRDKVFWLPHNMDFRGRVYPVPPHLNHLGSDLARSMLIFDQSQPLGVDGFSWLKLHCINLTGLKKRNSVRERLLYAEKVMPDILDSADNPLTGRKWWVKSDEPWQTLACCMEIAKVIRSPNPEEYQSRFPIHQDGSCNGLQHYAALGRDKTGAFSVNLVPSAVPQDVYSAVASLVEKSRLQDAAKGLHVAQALDGFVRRKVIKQTVMTTVYGVTRYGARLQIARQLKDIDNFPKDWVWPASTYLTTKTFESLREMFTSTREIQDWFTDCARLISGVCGQNVEWVTPLGFPIVQPYNKQELKPISKSTLRISETMSTDMFEKPNTIKQKNAFPPNFIHSLDSSHMMLTSLYCERAGLSFISVHDCFWTHACTVPQLNKICREQFVALHSQPILEDLCEFLHEKYSFKENDFFSGDSTDTLSKRNLNRVLCQMPKKGDFDLRNVLDSIYFFS